MCWRNDIEEKRVEESILDWRCAQKVGAPPAKQFLVFATQHKLGTNLATTISLEAQGMLPSGYDIMTNSHWSGTVDQTGCADAAETVAQFGLIYDGAWPLWLPKTIMNCAQSHAMCVSQCEACSVPQPPPGGRVTILAIIRDPFDAWLSGTLYHRSGQEPGWTQDRPQFLRLWKRLQQHGAHHFASELSKKLCLGGGCTGLHNATTIASFMTNGPPERALLFNLLGVDLQLQLGPGIALAPLPGIVLALRTPRVSHFYALSRESLTRAQPAVAHECLETLTSNSAEAPQAWEMIATKHFRLPQGRAHSFVAIALKAARAGGGTHAATDNRTLKLAFLRVAVTLDRTYFNNSIAALAQAVACGPPQRLYETQLPL